MESHSPETPKPQLKEITPTTNPFPLTIEQTPTTQHLQPQNKKKDKTQKVYFAPLLIFIVFITISTITINTATNAIQETNKIQIETIKFHIKLIVAINELTPTNCRNNNHTQKLEQKGPTTYKEELEQIKNKIQNIISCITQTNHYNSNTPTAKTNIQTTPNTYITTMNTWKTTQTQTGKPQQVTPTKKKNKTPTPKPKRINP